MSARNVAIAAYLFNEHKFPLKSTGGRRYVSATAHPAKEECVQKRLILSTPPILTRTMLVFRAIQRFSLKTEKARESHKYIVSGLGRKNSPPKRKAVFVSKFVL